MIQAAVKATVGESKVAVNVNADEAAVLGAALHGASLSRQFKTKDIKVADIMVYDMVASYPAEGKKDKTLTTAIFPRGTKHGTRKTMTFKKKEDFAVTLAYKVPPSRGLGASLLEARIGGVAEALKNITEMGATDAVVKATIALSESGFASVKEAFVVGDVKIDESIAGTFHFDVHPFRSSCVGRQAEGFLW
jgi:hypoxia up-regulated 1